MVIKMVREPGMDYDFELHLEFDAAGKLQKIAYKDVL